MDLRALRYFLAVADNGSFTVAANRLHIAQPAVSMAIRKLEEELELTLFHRNERHISLTDEGQTLLPHARQILQALADAELEMRELHEMARGEVRIGIPSMLGSYYFPPILMAFRHRYPQLRLSVVEAGTRQLQKMIYSGEIDMGVIVADTPPEDLESRSFLRDQMMAILPQDHHLAGQQTVRFRDFFAEDLVLFRKGYFHREVIDQLCREHDFSPKICFETNLLPLTKQIVKHGFGITTLLEMVIAEDADLVALPFEQPVWLDLSVAWRQGGYLSRANRTFVDFLLEHSHAQT